MYLAEFNIGVLKYDWGHPLLADFERNIDLIYTLAERSPGYVWHLSGTEMEQAQLDPAGPLGGYPRIASTLSVWAGAASLEAFTWNTLHKRFYDRKHEWYHESDQLWSNHRLVMWHVDVTHRPSIDEAIHRLDHLVEHGDSDFAFGWQYLKQTS